MSKKKPAKKAQSLNEERALGLARKLRDAASEKALKIGLSFMQAKLVVPKPRDAHVAFLDYFGWHFEMACVAYTDAVEHWNMLAVRKNRRRTASADGMTVLALFAGETTHEQGFVLEQLRDQMARSGGTQDGFQWFWFEGELPEGFTERVLAGVRAEAAFAEVQALRPIQNMVTPKGPPA